MLQHNQLVSMEASTIDENENLSLSGAADIINEPSPIVDDELAQYEFWGVGVVKGS